MSSTIRLLQIDRHTTKFYLYVDFRSVCLSATAILCSQPINLGKLFTKGKLIIVGRLRLHFYGRMTNR